MEDLRQSLSREDMDHLLMLDEKHFEWFLQLYPQHSRLGQEHSRRRPNTRIRMEQEEMRRQLAFNIGPYELRQMQVPTPETAPVDFNALTVDALLNSLAKPAILVLDAKTVDEASDLRLYPLFREVIQHVRAGIRFLDLKPGDAKVEDAVTELVEANIKKTYFQEEKQKGDAMRDKSIMSCIWSDILRNRREKPSEYR